MSAFPLEADNLPCSLPVGRIAINISCQDCRRFALLTGHGNFPVWCFGSWQARARYASMGGKLGLGATQALGPAKLVTNSSVDIGAVVDLPDERTQRAAAMMALTR